MNRSAGMVLVIILVAALLSVGCAQRGSPPAATPSSTMMSHGMMSPGMMSPGAGAMTMNGRGVVKSVRQDQRALTIDHDAIPSMNMAAMIMEFEVKDPAMLSGLQSGDAVEFLLVMEPGGRHVIQRLDKRSK